MTYDSTVGGNNPLAVVYNADGARQYEYKTGSYGFFRYYYYDRMGRMSGSINVDGQGMGLHNDPNACRYDQDDQMSVPCENGAPTLTFDGANVVSAWDGADKWHFVHAPGLDDPLIGLLRLSNGTRRELFWITDGSGREFIVADSTGNRPQDYDFNYAWSGWQYAGGTKSAQSFSSSRQESPELPGLSFFRNRVYDQNTGRWTQEDPIGLAGGVNLYQFNGNNPVMFTDPFGLSPEDCKKKVKCPSIAAIQGNPTVRAAGESMLKASMGDNAERRAYLFNGPNGTIRVGEVRVGKPGTGEVEAGVPPDDAIGEIHTHQPIPGVNGLSFPGGPPSGPDAARIREYNINGVVEEPDKRHFQAYDKGGNYYTVKRDPPVHP
jgi:RHS repeat-associated protein